MRLILFTQPGCKPCENAKRLLEGYDYKEVNIKEESDWVKDLFNLRITPTLLDKDLEVYEGNEGIKRWIESY